VFFIFEDEAFIATHLAVIIEEHDGEAVGPASSVAEALELIAAGAVIEGAGSTAIWVALI